MGVSIEGCDQVAKGRTAMFPIMWPIALAGSGALGAPFMCMEPSRSTVRVNTMNGRVRQFLGSVLQFPKAKDLFLQMAVFLRRMVTARRVTLLLLTLPRTLTLHRWAQVLPPMNMKMSAPLLMKDPGLR